MMSNSKIEWTDKTWNVVHGCTKRSTGCQNCYAERMALRLAGRYGYPEAPNHFDVTLRHDRLSQPLSWKKPIIAFVCSMSDLFHDDVPTEFVKDVLNVVHDARRHFFLFLTKRPERMVSILLDCDLPPNAGFGISAENSASYMQRYPHLSNIDARLRFVSAEPLLGSISAMQTPDWLIVGGETGSGARPMELGWARQLRDDCARNDVPFFFKKVGSGRETPPDLQIRQLPRAIIEHFERWRNENGAT